MALNIKDPQTEQLAAKVATLAGETKTGAINIALHERLERLTSAGHARAERLRRFLVNEAWPQIPENLLGTSLSKEQREAILGFGPEGV